MQISYSCPQCHATVQTSFDLATAEMKCDLCESRVTIPAGAISETNVGRCLVCPSKELFVRKDFPQRLGVMIVVLGFAASSVAWFYHMILTTYAILFATALIDVGLFLFMGDVLECYRCHAQYRGVDNYADHGAFDLEVHEKHRQQKARLQNT